MGHEGIILVNPPITTFQRSLTHSALVLPAPVLEAPVIVALVLSAPVLLEINTMHKNDINAVLSRIWKCRKSRIFGANFSGQKLVGANFTRFCNYAYTVVVPGAEETKQRISLPGAPRLEEVFHKNFKSLLSKVGDTNWQSNDHPGWLYMTIAVLG